MKEKVNNQVLFDPVSLTPSLFVLTRRAPTRRPFRGLCLGCGTCDPVRLLIAAYELRIFTATAADALRPACVLLDLAVALHPFLPWPRFSTCIRDVARH